LKSVETAVKIIEAKMLGSSLGVPRVQWTRSSRGDRMGSLQEFKKMAEF
jgi:hypothetical protein